MNNMPQHLKDELEADPFYKRCCVTRLPATSTKIDWHHNFIFAGRQVQEKWCILPLAKEVHDNIVYHKEYCDWVMLNRADYDTLRRYSKATDLVKMRDRLNKKYGIYSDKTAIRKRGVQRP